MTTPARFGWTRVSNGWLYAAFCLAIAAGCSTSDRKSDMEATTGSGGGGAGKGGSSAAAGSGSGSGSAQEGKPCRADADCSSGLSCVISVIGDFGFRHCARGCSKTEPCMDGEMCLTSTPSPDDSYCRNAVKEAFMPCGPGQTSFCEPPLTCIFPDEGVGTPVGICFNFCQLPTSSITISESAVLKTCPNGLTCAAALGDPDVGVCSKTVGRGEMCSIESGTLCGSGDLCVTEDASGASSCYQDCTKDSMCSNGKPCTKIDPEASICADP